jgi:hypothetical protein
MRFALLFITLCSSQLYVLAVEPVKPTEAQIKEILQKSAERKNYELDKAQKSLTQVRNAPLSGANKTEAAKQKGDAIKKLESRIAELKKKDVIEFGPVNLLALKNGKAGVGHFGQFSKQEHRIYKISNIIDKETLVLDCELRMYGDPKGVQKLFISFVIRGIDTTGMITDREIESLPGVFIVTGTTKIPLDTVFELQPLDVSTIKK